MILRDADYRVLETADAATIKQYIDRGFSVNTPIIVGRTGGKPVRHTLLHIAAQRGRLENVKFLLSYGANPDARDPDQGATPLHLCAEGNYGKIAETLAKAGADVNAKDSAGRTPLHTAAYWGAAEVARCLLSHGADANARNDVRETPLHAATAGNPGAVAVVQVLLEAGADRSASDRQGKTAAQRALEQADAFPVCREIARLLGAKPGFFQRLFRRKG